uniref:Vacuolar protein sorting-associated protein 33B n=1 Tax=Pygocentrus nattereri TaxID=42514 RepID=A0AAR2JIA2_PYGNA
MAHTGRRDAPELPDFSLLKRLARDQLIYLMLLPPRFKVYGVFNKPALLHYILPFFRLCFLIRPRIQTVKWIADIVNSDKASGRFRRYKIIFTPQKFYACETVLEEQGVYGDVTTDEWAFYLLPLDDDIISLELPEFFRDNFLEGDQRWVTTAGSALRLVYSLYGPFSKVYGIGRCAKMVYESWRDQVEDGEQKARQPEIGNVFLIDRDVDFVTPLCSQVVYEGLVDDIFRIKCGSVEFGPEVTSSDKSLKVMVNSQDKVFNEIRNEHFSNVFGFLSQKARNLQTAYDKRRGMDIQQMKTFVSEELKGLKQEHRLLSLHIGASECIMKKKTKQDFQELLKTEHCKKCGERDEINEKCTKPCLCAISCSSTGLLPKDYRSLKAQYLQSYGIEHLLTFANLKQIGLLVEQQPGETLTVMESKVGKLVNDKTAGKLTDAFSSLAKKSNFRALSKRLVLIPKSGEEYDLRVPRDMAYIFSGAYIPLSCKLIEQVLERDGWTGLEEVTRMLNGHEFAVTVDQTQIKTDPQRIILVMFLGGCTYSEISALRFLGREKGYKFIVLTTAITNSARLLEALLDNHA